MKIYALKALTLFEDSDDRISECHAEIFHGEADRPGRELFSVPMACLTNDVREPLLIDHSKELIPPVFMPDFVLVVSEEVKRELERFPHVEFLEARFRRLVSFYYEKGDFSYYDEHAYPDLDELDATDENPETYVSPGSYFSRLPDCPEAHENVGRYFEVLLAENDKIAPLYPDVQDLEINIPTYSDPVHCRVSPQLMQDYPFIWITPTTLFCTEDVLRVLNPYLDWDFFIKAEVEI